MDPVAKPTPGHWFWKEDTKTLEFSSNGVYTDVRERPRRGRAIHFKEHGNKASERYFNTGAKSPERSCSHKILKSSSLSNKREHEHVTLEDVKRVALNLLQENDHLYVDSFSATIRSQQLDDFFMALLYYLTCYLEKHSLERKSKSLFLQPSMLEKREMADLLARTNLALKHFAHTYCTLVLGEVMNDQHHMACGKSKGSATAKDRKFYECLYSFSIYLAWVVFRHKELDVIQEEVGRLFRSDAFNPALRQRDAPENPGRDLSAVKVKPKKTTTYAQSRREHPKRPAIKSIITQRSPALTSLLPSPKDKSQYLFQQHQLHPSNNSEPTDFRNWLDLPPALITPRIGILGEPLKQFQPHSLIPQGTEDEEESGREKESHASLYSRGLSSHHSGLRPGTGRQSTISRATTEAAYSDSD
ncbi:protein phosphatase 1 regulatory subunit 36 [Discoglossus pictus]